VFQQPSQGDRVDIKDLLGSLALFYVHDVRQGISTPFGEKEAVACDIHVLDGLKGGEIFKDALIFQGGLIGTLRSAAGGEPVLARVGHGVAKPGQSPPFVLQPFSEADAQLATTYINNRPKQFQTAGNGNTQAVQAPPANNGGGVDLSSLPQEVQELLKQSGAMPR
jgi:hypothetical protein